MSFADEYHALLAAGTIEPDPAQEDAVRAYSKLERAIASHRLARKSSSLGWLFNKSKKEPGPRGLYIHGKVGRGKTMLMDLFFKSSPVAHKRRAHFHEFMADVHERIHEIRKRMARGELVNVDPVKVAAEAIFHESWLIGFDEFHVTDIADAMILGRLFSDLFARGVVVIATSNVAPEDLYKDGLNRALFMPFIADLKKHMEVLRLDARTDFRLEKLAGLKVWHQPADAAAQAELERAFARVSDGMVPQSLALTIKGRTLDVPRAARGAAWFSFADLCEKPLGAGDYLHIAHAFRTLVIDHIPVMDETRRNEAKRFINLIDTLYDNGVKLVASADAPPQDLYTASHGTEAMEFQRTVSRLIEMGSQTYLALPHGERGLRAGDSSEGLVET